MKYNRLLSSSLLLISGAAAFAATPGENVILQGYERYNTEEKLGWYYVDANGSTEFVWADKFSEEALPLCFAWMKDGRICGVASSREGQSISGYQYLEINPENGEYFENYPISLKGSGQYADLTKYYLVAAYNPTDNRIYGYGYDSTGENFVFKSSSYDFEETKIIRIIDSSEFCFSITYNQAQGVLVGYNGKAFVAIDLAKGVQRELYAPVVNNYQSTYTALAYDAAQNAYYWNYFTKDQRSHLAKVDFTKRQFSVVCDYTNLQQFSAFFPVEMPVNPEAPAAPTITALNVEGAADNGSLTFTLPSAKNDGTPLQGDVKWEVNVAGSTLASGAGKPGESVTATLSNIPAGMQVFSVTAISGELISLAATESRYIGVDTPAAPENVKLDGTSLTWDAVTTGANGGYIDASGVVYNVYINDQLAGTATEPSFTVTYPAGQPYQTYVATVTATAGNLTSVAGESNIYRFGNPLSLPQTLNPTRSQATLFTVLDLDGSGTQFEFDSTNGREGFVNGFSADEAVDEWLFLPPVAATDDKYAYSFGMRANLMKENTPHVLIEVMAGTAANPEAMTTSVIARRIVSGTTQSILEGVVAFTEEMKQAGSVVFGIHLTASAGAQGKVRYFQIKKTNISANGPAAPTGVSVSPGAKGALNAKVEFRMPTKTLAGEALAADADVTVTVTGDSRESVTGKPGTSQEVTVKAYQGINEFVLEPSVGGVKGNPAKAESWCGIDVPSYVENFKVNIPDDNMSATVTWDAPARGLHDGYIDPAQLTYNLCEYNSVTATYTPIKDLGNTTTTVIEASSSKLQNMTFTIQAVSSAGPSNQYSGTRIQLGKPYELNMTENFYDSSTGGQAMHYSPYILVTSNEYEGTSWRIQNPAEIRSEYEVNRTNVALVCTTDAANTEGYFEIPKFSTADSENVDVSITYYQGSSAPTVKLYAQTVGMVVPREIGTFANEGTGYKRETISLPLDFLGRGWVSVSIHPEFSTQYQVFVMPNFMIQGGSGVEEALEGEVTVKGFNGGVLISGADGENAEVYSLSGMKVASVKCEASTMVSLEKGVYVVRVAGKTFKVAL